MYVYTYECMYVYMYVCFTNQQIAWNGANKNHDKWKIICMYILMNVCMYVLRTSRLQGMEPTKAMTSGTSCVCIYSCMHACMYVCMCVLRTSRLQGMEPIKAMTRGKSGTASDTNTVLGTIPNLCVCVYVCMYVCMQVILTLY
jgi:hypothetical protein